MRDLTPDQAAALELLADDIEREWQPWPGARAELTAWLVEQFDRTHALGVHGRVAREMIYGSYLEYVSDRLAGKA